MHEHEWEDFQNERNCGCVFVKCRVCGVIKKTGWCAAHEAARQKYRGAQNYYRENLGMEGDGIPRNTEYAAELQSALDAIGYSIPNNVRVLELGCGVGRLVHFFLKKKCEYLAVEPDRWATSYVTSVYGVRVLCRELTEGTLVPNDLFDVIVSTHALEHIPDSDMAFNTLVDHLAPGGALVLAVPEAWDYWNPDHIWMFNESILDAWGAERGLRKWGSAVFKRSCPEPVVYHVQMKV